MTRYMTRHEDRKILPYRPDQMFNLVGDIGRYPEFIPWCAAARVRSQGIENDAGIRIRDADLVIAFTVFRETFTSRVTLDTPRKRIDVAYLNGPFKTLVNHWQFHDHPDGVEIDFSVEFEFKSRILEAVAGKVFNEAMRKIMGAFEVRAKELYG